MTDVADRGPAPAQTGASAVKTGAMGSFVAIFWVFNDVVGLAILGLATLLNLAVRYLTWRRAPNVIVGDP